MLVPPCHTREPLRQMAVSSLQWDRMCRVEYARSMAVEADQLLFEQYVLHEGNKKAAAGIVDEVVERMFAA